MTKSQDMDEIDLFDKKLPKKAQLFNTVFNLRLTNSVRYDEHQIQVTRFGRKPDIRDAIGGHGDQCYQILQFLCSDLKYAFLLLVCFLHKIHLRGWSTVKGEIEGTTE